MNRPADGCLWSLAGALLGFLFVVAFLILARARGSSLASATAPAPILTVIPFPTPSPLASPTSEAQSATVAAEVPTPGVQSPRQFSHGELVEVFGTGGDGLRLRDAPGLEAPILSLGLESEVFEVVEGPVVSDGFSWWRLANPYDPGKQGWAVDSFLRSLES